MAPARPAVCQEKALTRGITVQRATSNARKGTRTASVSGEFELTSFRKEPNMTTWLTRCFAFLLLMLPFVPAVADDPDDKEIARLVKQLGSSDYRTRDAATKRLTEIGEPAFDALGKAKDTLEMR